MPKKPSLDEFLADPATGNRRLLRRCAVCNVKERAEIDQALRGGAAPVAIARWLATIGHKIGVGSVYGHMQKQHHQETA